MRQIIFTVLSLLIIFISNIFATTVNVPDDYLTIQMAVNASSSGDTILISNSLDGDAEGNHYVLIEEKALTFRSAYGNVPAELIFDLSLALMVINDVSDGIVVFENLIISNARSPFYGYIQADSASVKIANCSFINCETYGPGMNYPGLGGAVYINEGSSIIENCYFENNHVDEGSGGAIAVVGGDIQIINSVFINNRAILDTGDLFEAFGGAIYFNNTEFFVESCLFDGNAVLFYLYDQNGGAIGLQNSTGTIRNCTFNENRAKSGGAIYGSGFKLYNSIITDNYPESIYGTPDSIMCADIYGNNGNDWIGDFADQLGLNGNFSADPLFCDSDSGDFRLQPESSCLPENNTCKTLIGSENIGCEIYICGDANYDTEVSILDITYLLAFLYQGGAVPPVYELADPDGDGSINILDIIYLIAFLYQLGPAPLCN